MTQLEAGVSEKTLRLRTHRLMGEEMLLLLLIPNTSLCPPEKSLKTIPRKPRKPSISPDLNSEDNEPGKDRHVLGQVRAKIPTLAEHSPVESMTLFLRYHGTPEGSEAPADGSLWAVS